MKEESVNTEQAILKAAEKEFLKKGFSGSKTTEIAKAAGVTHAMLHYYFRTKKICSIKYSKRRPVNWQTHFFLM